mmetsp:Transcript_53580/g.142025  ORF Transcript_53580/g.142025 Transcript_53580/m.142025 type:complete len:136 (+) Transcript_53580:286-693(+)
MPVGGAAEPLGRLQKDPGAERPWRPQKDPGGSAVCHAAASIESQEYNGSGMLTGRFEGSRVRYFFSEQWCSQEALACSGVSLKSAEGLSSTTLFSRKVFAEKLSSTTLFLERFSPCGAAKFLNPSNRAGAPQQKP